MLPAFRHVLFEVYLLQAFVGVRAEILARSFRPRGKVFQLLIYIRLVLDHHHRFKFFFKVLVFGRRVPVLLILSGN